jgi:hypothetical protein
VRVVGHTASWRAAPTGRCGNSDRHHSDPATLGPTGCLPLSRVIARGALALPHSAVAAKQCGANINLLCACQTAEMGSKTIHLDCLCKAHFCLLRLSMLSSVHTDYRVTVMMPWPGGAPFGNPPLHISLFHVVNTRPPAKGVGINTPVQGQVVVNFFLHNSISGREPGFSDGDCGIDAPVRCRSPVLSKQMLAALHHSASSRHTALVRHAS